MDADLPPELAEILTGPDPAALDRAWSRFLSRHNRLLLKAASRFGGDYDARMDRYRHLLEQLAADNFRRLRSYQIKGHSTFAAWLSVVAGRLCVDYERSLHGRAGRATQRPDAAAAGRLLRRRLASLADSSLDPDQLPEDGHGPDGPIREAELHRAVESALDGLSPQDRLLIRLRFEDGLPVGQIADVMGFPTVFHVYRALRLVLSELRSGLEVRGITDASA
jgi:RNA polymerase sigma factor (sigma-70 family)